MSEKIVRFEKDNEIATEDMIQAEMELEDAQVSNKSKLFQLEEMSESMIQSIANVEKISNEQIELCSILENAETENDFTSFIEATRRQTENLSRQVATLAERQSLLNQVIVKCHENHEIEEAVMQLVDALGVFA